MELEVTKNFEKQFGKLDAQRQKAVEDAFEKLADNPQSVKFERKVGNAKDVYSMRVDGNYRVAFTKNADGNFVPAFVGNHRDYDRFLDQKPNKLTPSALLGDDNARVKTMDLKIPDDLRQQSVLRKSTSFSIGDIKLRGVVGTVITAGTAVLLNGGVKEAVASTTPGHVGLELAEGDIKGATEALVVDGTGDVGCLVKYGAAGGATVGAGFAGVGAGPGALIGGGVAAVGGCIVGGIAASQTAQAVWNWLFEDDEDRLAGPAEILAGLKEQGIEDIPDEVSPDMPDDLKELVMYKKGVADALEDLNEKAQTLADDPTNESAREAFIEASSTFSQAGEAYQYSAASMENPEEVQQYMQEAQQQADAPSVAGAMCVYEPAEENNHLAVAAP